MSRKLFRIMGMEFGCTTANKAFIVLTILGPFLIAAVTVLPSVLTMNQAGLGAAETRVAVVNAAPAYLAGIEPALVQAGIRAFALTGDAVELDARVLAGEFEGYLILPDDLAGATRIEYVSTNVSDIPRHERARGRDQPVGGGPAAVEGGDRPRAGGRDRSSPRPIETRKLAKTGEKEIAGLPHHPLHGPDADDAPLHDRAALRAGHRPVGAEREDLEDRRDHALVGEPHGPAVRQGARQGAGEHGAVRRVAVGELRVPSGSSDPCSGWR